MIIKQNANQPEERENMRGGAGTVSIRPMLSGGDLPPNCRLFAKITLPPGASIGEHVHENECELFYFLGPGKVLDDGKPADVQAGDSMYTGSGHNHSVINNGAEPLELIAVIIKE